MKSLRILLLLVVAAVTATTASAKSWRANPSEMSGAEYTSIAQVLAHPGFAEGDTIICDPGNYGEVTIGTKDAVLMGPGYFKTQNGTQSNGVGALFASITCTATGVKLVGLEVDGNITIVNNCQVQRCRAGFVTGDQNELPQYCVITQNYISGARYMKYSVVKNNIFATGNSCYLLRLDNTEITHNTCLGASTLYYLTGGLTRCTIKDNILIHGQYTGLDYTFKNNGNTLEYNVISSVSNDVEETFTVGNKYGNGANNTFVQEGGVDGRLRVRDDSAAKGAASDGTDCGAFGGANPYVLSGSPVYMPQITNAAISPDQSNGKVRVKLTIATQLQ